MHQLTGARCVESATPNSADLGCWWLLLPWLLQFSEDSSRGNHARFHGGNARWSMVIVARRNKWNGDGGSSRPAAAADGTGTHPHPSVRRRNVSWLVDRAQVDRPSQRPRQRYTLSLCAYTAIRLRRRCGSGQPTLRSCWILYTCISDRVFLMDRA